ncbi:MAG: hypothetical protein HUU27_03290, partial [Phycisphaerae bacterium]|nr:hypothetical protein [Phycisphaerae bacterium]
GETDDLVGGPEIIALDGADGLRFVASRIGAWLAADQRAGVSEMPVVWFDEQHGEGAAAAVLRSAAGHDPNVARYLAYLDGLAGREIGGGATFRDLHQLRLSPNAQQAHAARWRGVSAADVIREIEQAPPGLDRFGFQYWGVHASSADLEAVLGRLVAETEPGRLCKYLHIFWRRAMPRLPAEVPALADHADADVRRAAIRAMAAIRHPAARALALRRLAAQRHDDDELNLLVENYEPGDAERIARQVAMPDDPHRRHSLIMDLVHVFERNATPEAAPVMLFCYEHTPCSNCRRKAVGVLLKAGVAPAWLVEECRCDVDDGTRKLVEAGGAA